MKRALILMLLILSLAVAAWGTAQDKGKESEPVIRTYELKYVDPTEIFDSVSPFVLQRLADRGSKFLVVTVLPENVKALEELLARLDVEKPLVTFRIFTLIASQKAGTATLEVPELAEAVANLKRVLGFKSYVLDGVSLITMRSGARSRLELNSRIRGLTLDLNEVRVDPAENGKRRVRLGLELSIRPQAEVLGKDQAIVSHELIKTEQTSIAENGTLVAGVSRVGEAGDALVLVIQASIQ